VSRWIDFGEESVNSNIPLQFSPYQFDTLGEVATFFDQQGNGVRVGFAAPGTFEAGSDDERTPALPVCRLPVQRVS